MALGESPSNTNMHYILNKEKLLACYVDDDISILTRSIDWIYDDQLLSELLQLSCGIQSPHSPSFKSKLKFIKDFVSIIREEKSVVVVPRADKFDSSYVHHDGQKYRIMSLLLTDKSRVLQNKADRVLQKEAEKRMDEVKKSKHKPWSSIHIDYDNYGYDGL